MIDLVNQLVDLLPIFTGCVIGSIFKDLVDFTKGKAAKHRALQVFISIGTTTIVLGFLVVPVIPPPPVDWKLLFGGSFGIGFLGYRLASFLSNTLFALTLIPGADKIQSALERQIMEERIEKLEKKTEVDEA